jgi:hypothetical protein
MSEDEGAGRKSTVGDYELAGVLTGHPLDARRRSSLRFDDRR